MLLGRPVVCSPDTFRPADTRLLGRIACTECMECGLLLPMFRGLSLSLCQGCSGAGTRGDDVLPLFFDTGDASPTPILFGLKFVQKLVHCCNWLLTETQCKIILISICYRHSNTSSCIAGQDQRSAVAIFLTCMSVRVCRPKLFKGFV